MAMSCGLHMLPAWMLLLLVTHAAGHTLAVAKTPLVAEHAASRLLLQRKTAAGGGGSSGLIPKPPQAVGNPFLTADIFPRFDLLKPSDLILAAKQLKAELIPQIEQFEKNVTLTREGLLNPLERITDRRTKFSYLVSLLATAKDSQKLREAVEEASPLLIDIQMRVDSSYPLYMACKNLSESPGLWAKLTAAEQRVVSNQLKKFFQGGVSLVGKKREEYLQLSKNMSALSIQFSNNVLDGTKAWTKLVTDPKRVEGIPPSGLAAAAQTAAENGHPKATAEKGPWMFTLASPSYLMVMENANDRSFREEVFRADNAIGSGKGDASNNSNLPVINQMLKLRKRQANLLGLKNYAEYAMVTNMATVETAYSLLDQLRNASWAGAQAELAELQEFAAKAGNFTEKIKWWDERYWATRLKEAKYDVKETEVGPYLALPNVLKGMFQFAKRLFGVDVVEAEGEVTTWDKDVKFFKVLQEGKPIAYFYLDPYARPGEKGSGASMNGAISRSTLLAPPGQPVRLPVAYLVLDATPPVGKDPSLMSFHEMQILLHEFGHALQHMLTTQSNAMVAGIEGVELDASEFASQFNEFWVYDRKTLFSIAKHYQTGKSMPEEMYQKLLRARNFRAASATMRQLRFALMDLDLHTSFLPGNGNDTIFDVAKRVTEKTNVLGYFPNDRFLLAFDHIFVYGYAAGYYSYKWAEVLAADAFGAFVEGGLANEASVERMGKKYRDTILAMGGGKAPKDVFVSFRGRPWKIETLLQLQGLVKGGPALTNEKGVGA